MPHTKIETTAAHPPSFTAYGIPNIPVPWIRLVTFHPARNALARLSSEGLSISDTVIVAERNFIKLRDKFNLERLIPRRLFAASDSPWISGAFSPKWTTVGFDSGLDPNGISSPLPGLTVLGFFGVLSKALFSAIVFFVFCHVRFLTNRTLKLWSNVNMHSEIRIFKCKCLFVRKVQHNWFCRFARFCCPMRQWIRRK